MRTALNLRLGMGAMGVMSPGHSGLLDSFLQEAQELLYFRYDLFRTERFYSWALVANQHFYNFSANLESASIVNPRKLTWVGISRGNTQWQRLISGISPEFYTSLSTSIPTHFEIREAIELWPTPKDATWTLRIKGDFGLGAFAVDTDKTTLDHQAIAMLSLANAKAHFGQPDAGNYMSQLTSYMHGMIAGSHQGRRYIPRPSTAGMKWDASLDGVRAPWREPIGTWR